MLRWPVWCPRRYASDQTAIRMTMRIATSNRMTVERLRAHAGAAGPVAGAGDGRGSISETDLGAGAGALA
jgi:hypothetical protein